MINEVLIVAINSSHVMLHHHIRVSFFNQPALANPRSNQNNGIEIFYTRRESPLADYLTKFSSPGLKFKRDKILFYCIFDEFLATCVSQTSLNHFSTILCFNYQQHFSSFDLWRHWELVLESECLVWVCRECNVAVDNWLARLGKIFVIRASSIPPPMIMRRKYLGWNGLKNIWKVLQL